MANRYLLPSLPPPGRTQLTGDLAHHLARVLRIEPGAALRLGDGRGGTADARVLATDKRTVTVEVGEASVSPELQPRITLAFACPRQSRADWLIEHGTEVGIAAFQPLWCARSRPQKLRLDRWRKIADAAVGQCDRAWSPELREPLDLAAWLRAELPPRRLLADAAGPRLAGADRQPTVLLVGPEGGFRDDEIAAAEAAGFAKASYAPHTLRTETAALVGAAVLLAGCD